MVVLPRRSAVHSAVAVSPSGTAARKLVLLSIVVVHWPAARFATVATPPSVSASAITAPPCSTAGRVHSSGRTFSRATTRSGVTSTSSTPRKSENGMAWSGGMVAWLLGAARLARRRAPSEPEPPGVRGVLPRLPGDRHAGHQALLPPRSEGRAADRARRSRRRGDRLDSRRRAGLGPHVRADAKKKRPADRAFRRKAGGMG